MGECAEVIKKEAGEIAIIGQLCMYVLHMGGLIHLK